MDLPIPFSNLGSVISSLIPAEKLGHFLRINCMQIIRFAQTYIQHEPSVTLQLDWILRQHEAENTDAPNKLKAAIERVQQVLREIWTSFDIPTARLGLIALLEAIAFALVQLVSQVANVQGDFYGNLTLAIWLFRSGFFLLQLSLFLAGSGDGLIVPLLNMSLLLSLGYHVIVLGVQMLSLRLQWKAVIPFIVAIGHSLSFLSNSFIVYEPSVIRFILQTIIFASIWVLFKKIKLVFILTHHFMWVLPTLSRPTCYPFLILETYFRNPRKAFFQTVWKNHRFALFSVISVAAAVRFGAFFERCREEQVDCVQTLLVSTLSSLPLDSSKFFRIAFGIAALAGLNYLLLKQNRKIFKI